MATEVRGTIQCPNCNQTLLGGATWCQFCGKGISASGQAVVNAPRAMAGVTIMSGAGAKSQDFGTWQEKAYRVCCVLFAIYGLFDIAAALQVIPGIYKPHEGTYYAVLGSIHLIAGILLYMEVGWVQYVMKWWLILGIVRGCFSFLMLPIVFAFNTGLGVMYALISTVALAVEGMMLYLLYQVGDV